MPISSTRSVRIQSVENYANDGLRTLHHPQGAVNCDEMAHEVATPAFAPSQTETQSRRALFESMKRTSFSAATSSFFLSTINESNESINYIAPASALDIDAFMSKELDVDKEKSVLSDDVKTCKYAAPGKEKGDACVRAGMSTEGKNGGVDAYGRINRGDFVRCQTSYPMVDGQYVKTITCQ